MMRRMKFFAKFQGKPRAWLLAAAMAIAMFANAGVASAATEGELKNDARYEGYPGNVVLEGGSGMYYATLVFVGLIVVVVMFKDAKRSPADL